MELKVLGTVSPYCQQDKNCPGYLITIEDSKVLLDCGNGITRNLKFPNDLNNLTIIISHLHRDHYGELFSIAYASYVYHNLNLLTQRIKVYIPYPTSKEEILDYNFLTNLGTEQFLEIIPYQLQDTIIDRNTTISFSKNPHSIPSYSIKIKHKDKTIIYSGDTGYIGNTIEKFAAGANLLICESTFLKHQKKSNDYHLCAHEAAQIANAAKVKKLLLTHFWPNIDKREYLEEALQTFDKTLVAEENMILKLK